MSTTTAYQDALARVTAERDQLQIPASPVLSNPFEPSTADLVAQAAYMMALTKGCAISAEPGERANPYATIGALSVLTEYMHRWLAARLAEEERNLLLLDRCRHEANQEAAHEHLMATDAEYAEDFEAEGDDE